MNPIANFTKAAYFAAIKHTGQLRKNANNEPYINHPLHVASLIAESGVFDDNILCAAVLHDTLEDTQTTENEIQTLFGEQVLNIVKECSDDKSLGKVERKIYQIEHSKHISKSAKIVKLADKLSNMGSVIEAAPKGWSEARVKGYILWGSLVCEQMLGVNQFLEDKLRLIYQKFDILALNQQEKEQSIQAYYKSLLQTKQK